MSRQRLAFISFMEPEGLSANGYSSHRRDFIHCVLPLEGEERANCPPRVPEGLVLASSTPNFGLSADVQRATSSKEQALTDSATGAATNEAHSLRRDENVKMPERC